jgi:ribosomal protein S18 acetylase RimI-like enzyme
MIQTPKTEEDFRQLAKLHKDGLGHLEYFLSRSSLKFIQFFYETISRYDSTILLIDKDESGLVLGYIFSSGDKNNYLKRFFKENAGKILLYFSAYVPTIRAIFRRFRRTKNINYNQELLYMAVHPDYRSQKIGTGLLIEVQNKLAEKYDECFLQVHGQNTKAHALYEILGFTDIHRYHIGTVEKIVMWKKLVNNTPVASGKKFSVAGK